MKHVLTLLFFVLLVPTVGLACEEVSARFDAADRTVHVELDAEVDTVCLYDEHVCFNVNPDLDAPVAEPLKPEPVVSPPEVKPVDPQ